MNGRGARANRKQGDSRRIPGRFIALPLSVLDSEAYLSLSAPAKALLIELARQHMGRNNGQLVLTARHLVQRGWRSNDVISRAKRQLVESGLVFETVKGGRPHWASWYALTWYSLDPSERYDSGTARKFTRGAYLYPSPNYPLQNRSLTPSAGVRGLVTAPGSGQKGHGVAPANGAVHATSTAQPTPAGGALLEEPSPVAVRHSFNHPLAPRADEEDIE